MSLHQDPLLRRSHGFFALALLLFIGSNLLQPIPLLAFLAGLSSLTLFGMAYVGYFRAPAYAGQRWRPIASLALVAASLVLIAFAYKLRLDALEARDAAAIVNAFRFDLAARVASIGLESLGWFFLGMGAVHRTRIGAQRVRTFLAGAVTAAVVLAGITAFSVLPELGRELGASLEGPEGQRALGNATPANESAAFVYNAAANATRDYRTVLDLGDLVPRLLGLGGFYLLWTGERDLRRQEEASA